MKHDLRRIWTAPDRTTASSALDIFAGKYGPTYDKAVQCLVKDQDQRLAFFDFPAEHWDHIRTTDEMDKHNLVCRGMFSLRGRPRGEEWRAGCERR